MSNGNGPVPDMTKEESSLDHEIAPGLRLWMLLAMIMGVLLAMTIVICCLIKIRIPRTKREIEMNATKRSKKVKGKGPLKATTSSKSLDLGVYHHHAERSSKVIVMSSLPTTGSLLPPPSDVETNSCTSCETSEENRDRDRDPSPAVGSKNNNNNKSTRDTPV